jgi:hypothetical protein
MTLQLPFEIAMLPKKGKNCLQIYKRKNNLFELPIN